MFTSLRSGLSINDAAIIAVMSGCVVLLYVDAVAYINKTCRPSSQLQLQSIQVITKVAKI